MSELLKEFLSDPRVQVAIGTILTVATTMLISWFNKKIGTVLSSLLGVTTSATKVAEVNYKKINDAVDRRIADMEDRLMGEMVKISRKIEIEQEMNVISNMGAKRLSSDNKMQLIKLNDELRKYAPRLAERVQVLLEQKPTVEEELKVVEVKQPKTYI